MQNFRYVHCLLVHPFGRPFILLLDLVLMTNQMKVNTSRGIVTHAIFLWEEDTESSPTTTHIAKTTYIVIHFIPPFYTFHHLILFVLKFYFGAFFMHHLFVI